MAPRHHHQPTPIERHPHWDIVPLPHDWGLKAGGKPYRPHDHLPYGVPDQEDWESVARKFQVDVKYLIYFNFMTDSPDEVNWYLRHYVGCVKVSPSGNNWMFSNGANPGIIYIPPSDDEQFEYPAENICVWTSDSIRKFMMRLFTVSRRKSRRVRRLVNVILRAGYPKCLDLWYYNGMAVEEYVDWRTGNAKRRDMTKDTNGTCPFDGSSGLYSQSGWWEINRGLWRVHPMQAVLLPNCYRWNNDDVEEFLDWFDRDIARGWDAMRAAQGKMATRAGPVYGDLVPRFIEHVRRLSRDPADLYSAFPP